nr:helix-turn-helix domain-containing protein [Xanthomonas oryzae]
MSVSAVQPSMMKRDGRLVSRAALEEMRLMALQRMGEGESPAKVAASFGLHRGWAYKVLARAQEGGACALMTRHDKGRRVTLNRT